MGVGKLLSALKARATRPAWARYARLRASRAQAWSRLCARAFGAERSFPTPIAHAFGVGRLLLTSFARANGAGNFLPFFCALGANWYFLRIPPAPSARSEYCPRLK